MQKMYADQDASKARRFSLAHARRSLGFVVEIDGEFAAEYGTLMAALKAAFELRGKFPHSQVRLHEVNEQRD